MDFLDQLLKEISSKNLVNGNSKIIVLLTGLIIFIELLWVGWPNSSIKKILLFKRTSQADAALFLIGLTKISYYLETIFSVGIAYLFFKFSSTNTLHPLYTWPIHPVLSLLICFIITDFLRYWNHRLFHYIDVLWELHAYHHAAEEMNVLAFYRHHFMEITCSRLLRYLPAMLMGGSVFKFIPVWISVYCLEMLQHSSLTANWGFVGKYILVSPAAHQVHHSNDHHHYNKNFGQVFIIWDKLFNTYYEPVHEHLTFGLSASTGYNQRGVLADIMLVFRRFFIKCWEKVN